jgi:hypothetical protein
LKVDFPVSASAGALLGDCASVERCPPRRAEKVIALMRHDRL